MGTALRIARRTVRRNIGRSVLIAALVGIPVAGATLVDVLYRSTGNPDRDTYQEIGVADARMDITGLPELPAEFFPRGNTAWGWDGQDTELRGTAGLDPLRFLPEGSRAVPAGAVRYSEVVLTDDDRTVRPGLLITALGDPLAAHEARLESGRMPAAGDEVMVTEALAERLDLFDGDALAAGARISVRDGGTFAVTGIALQPFCLRCESVVVPPGSPLTETGEPWSGSPWPNGTGYYVDLPDGVDADDLWPELAAAGVALVPRAAYLTPDRYDPYAGAVTTTSVYEAQRTAAVSIVVGLGLLEVVLLAGAAFAVGAKRQTRELGLLAASGGSARHVRNTVLAQGLVLGAVGATAGIATGALIAAAGKPVWERATNELIESWRFGPSEIALAAAVGVIAGLAAAIVPAVGASRMNPIDALAGRFRAGSARARVPLAGVAVLGLGALVAFAGNRIIADEFAAYAERLAAAEGSGTFVSPPAIAVPVLFQLSGLVIAITGLVILMPSVVALVARLARRMPLSTRYAVRDAARHRHRTAPAVAAIMIVVTGTVGAAFAIGGLERSQELRSAPALPENVLQVVPAVVGEPVAPVADAAAAELPAATTLEAHQPTVDAAGEDLLQLELPTAYIDECAPDCVTPAGGWSVVAGDASLIGVVTGRDADSRHRAALDSGEVVVFDAAFLDADGMVSLNAAALEQPLRVPGRLVERAVPYGSLPGAVVSPELAERHGWTTVPATAYVVYDAATPDQVDAAIDAVESRDAYAFVERPSQGQRAIYVALIAGSAFVTLVGVAISVALAAAESRSDLATLSAVGAAPRRRRLIAGSQALVVGGLGTGLGLALATYIAFTAWPTTGSPDFIVPWGNMMLTGIAVPALAVAVAITFTPSRLPLMRRVE